MAINAAIAFINGEQLPNTNSVLYSVGTDVTRILIDQARLVNFDTAPHAVTIYILQPGDSVADNFKAIVDVTVGAEESFLLANIIGQAIDSGGSVQGFADAASSVALSLTGTEFTT